MPRQPLDILLVQPSGRGGQCFFDGPPVPDDSLSNAGRADAVEIRPLLDTRRYAVMGQQMIRSRVSALYFSRCPSAVSLAVVSVIISSIYFRFWKWPYLGPPAKVRVVDRAGRVRSCRPI